MASDGNQLECGCPSPRYFARQDTGEMIVSACRMWKCPHCGPKRSAELSLRVKMGLNVHQRRIDSTAQFLTLTLDPKRNVPSGLNGTSFQARYVSECWRSLISTWRERSRRAGIPPLWYVKVAEWRDRTAAMHIHVLILGWIPSGDHLKQDIVNAGFGHVYDIQRVRSAKRVARYLTGYVTKTVKADAPRYVHRYSFSRGGLAPLTLWKPMVAHGYLKAFKNEDSPLSQSSEIWWTGEIRQNIENWIESLHEEDDPADKPVWVFAGLGDAEIPEYVREDGDIDGFP